MNDPPTQDQDQVRPRWWQWPTVLSLDAPAVSVVWLVLLGGCLQTDVGPPEMFVLGVSVWLAYAADRFIEGWRLAPEDVRTPRHRFYQRWRGPVAGVWVAVLIADVIVAATRLTRTEWMAGWVLTAAVAAYLLSHQFLHRTRRWRVPKEICVAGLLTGGIAVFLVGSTPLTALLPPLMLFSALCFVNCVLISAWERDVDRSHQQSSLALDGRQTAWIHWAPWLLAVIAIVGVTNAPVRTVAGCTAVSALLLAAIDHFQRRMGWGPARVLADLALLTPVRGTRGHAMTPLDGKASSRSTGFDRVATIYRVLEYAAFGKALEAARFRYLDRLKECRGILIIGEGDGRVLQRVLALAPRASVRCIDNSAAMLARAATRLAPADRGRVSFECADARIAAIPANAYDAVVTMFVLDCFSPADVGRLVERLTAGLRPDGVWLFADFSIPQSGWRRVRARVWIAFLYAFFRWRAGLAVRELPPSEDILRAAGLSVVEAETLQRGLLTTAVYVRSSFDGARWSHQTE